MWRAGAGKRSREFVLCRLRTACSRRPYSLPNVGYPPYARHHRLEENDIRIQLPNVSRVHTELTVEDGKVFISNLSKSNPTMLNKCALKKSMVIPNGAVFTVGDRSFRFEYSPLHAPDDGDSVVSHFSCKPDGEQAPTPRCRTSFASTVQA